MKFPHMLFGGSKTKDKNHKVYEVDMEKKDGSFRDRMVLLEQVKICEEISCVPSGAWLEELKEQGINLTDVGNEGREIHVLTSPRSP